MSGLAWAMTCFLGGLVVISFGDLVSEEVRGWLDLLPRSILRLAARRLEPETREVIYEEDWLPELIYALRGAESRPITRVIKGTYFALGLFISARKIEAIPPAVSTTASVEVVKVRQLVPGLVGLAQRVDVRGGGGSWNSSDHARERCQ